MLGAIVVTLQKLVDNNKNRMSDLEERQKRYVVRRNKWNKTIKVVMSCTFLIAFLLNGLVFGNAIIYCMIGCALGYIVGNIIIKFNLYLLSCGVVSFMIGLVGLWSVNLLAISNGLRVEINLGTALFSTAFIMTMLFIIGSIIGMINRDFDESTFEI